MADPGRPLHLEKVIWFGSLEFMSLDYGYDMVLLPPRSSSDDDYHLSQPGGAVRSGRRSRRRRRNADRLLDEHRRPAVPFPLAAVTNSLAGGLSGVRLTTGGPTALALEPYSS